MDHLSGILLRSLLVLFLVLASGEGTRCRSEERQNEKPQNLGPAKDAEVVDFLRENNLSKVAEDAILALRGYLARELTQKQRDKVEKQLERFIEIRKSGKVRSGGKWVSKDEALAAAKKADQLVSQALQKLEKGDGKGTLADLEKACRTNPDGIKAFFTLGMLFSIRGNCNPFRAEDYFAEVVKRSPDYLPALINLAICEIKTRKFGDAYAHFRQAAAISPDSPELLQNVCRVVHEAQQRQLPVPDNAQDAKKGPTRLDRFEELAHKLSALAERGRRKFNPKVGWLYVPYVQTEREQEAAPEIPPDVAVAQLVNAPDNLVCWAEGTGFAVAPDVLITNRHVVKHEQMGLAHAVTVQLPDAIPAKDPIRATILAVSDINDLAILKVDGANYTPIGISNKPLKRGREVLVLGYPMSKFLGSSLKTTRGVITALEEKQFDGMVMMDAEANPGNSGGPVCDRTGALVGVLTAVTNKAIGDYTLAVPAGKVNDFSTQHGTPLMLLQNVPDAADWSEIDERVSPSVFLVQTHYRPAPLRVRERLPAKIRPARSEYEDDSCSWCCGRGAVRCGAAGCFGGARPVTELYTVTIDVSTVNMGTVRTQGAVGTRTREFKCDTCRGRGHVNCPLCKGKGIDPDLR